MSAGHTIAITNVWLAILEVIISCPHRFRIGILYKVSVLVRTAFITLAYLFVASKLVFVKPSHCGMYSLLYALIGIGQFHKQLGDGSTLLCAV